MAVRRYEVWRELPDLALRIAAEALGSTGVASDWTERLDPSDPDSTEALTEPKLTQIVLKARRGTRGQAFLTGQDPDDEALFAFVEQIHDVILEASAGRAFPVCPGHPHPATPRGTRRCCYVGLPDRESPPRPVGRGRSRLIRPLR